MSTVGYERFLAPRPRAPDPHGSRLGRHYQVVRETWPVAADPKSDPPDEAVMRVAASAAEAADHARQLAGLFARHGFHKPSGAWWGADGERFHRFLVRPTGDRPQTKTALIVALGLSALLAVAHGARKKGKGGGKPKAKGEAA